MRRVVAVGAMLALAAAAACTADQVTAPSDEARVVVRAKALASTAALVVEISGPGIDPALVFNISVGPDTVAQDTLLVPSGGARRFVVTAIDTLGAATHRADTTMRLLPGLQPSVSFVLAPIAVSEDSIAFASGTLVAGERHTCGLTEDGSAYCWGSNDFGQLGDGTTLDRGAPTAVGGGHVFVYLTAGARHTCGLLESGEAFCWGDGAAGQLGTFQSEGTTIPKRVAGALLFRRISAGFESTCALTAASGRAYCWGEGRYSDPRQVAGGRSFDLIEVGYIFACAVERGGAAYCWGHGGTNTGSQGIVTEGIPALVSGGLAFSAISVGGAFSSTRACGVTTAGWGGHVYCWGRDLSVAPVPAATQASFRTVSMRGEHVCALSAGGTAYCWGANGSGELGDGTFLSRSTPMPVSVTGGFASIAAGAGHTCGLALNGTALCWGYSYFGRLGDGTMLRDDSPKQLPGAERIFSLAVSALGHSCAVFEGAQARCWGSNQSGQLGDGTVTRSSTPVPVAGALRFTRIATSYYHSCGVTESGAAYCWGRGDRLGAGDSLAPVLAVSIPSRVAVSVPILALEVGTNHSCAIDEEGAAWCWGRSGFSRLGFGVGDFFLQPGRVSGGLSFVSLALGNQHSCGLTAGGLAYCWGYSFEGGLGSVTSQQASPVAVTGGLQFSQLVAGISFTCGLALDGAAYCWGRNDVGQLGDGTTTNRLAPGPVAGGIRFSRLSTGLNYDHVCGLTQEGQAYCWGANAAGNLGDGTRITRTVPVPVAGEVRFKAIAVAKNRTCAIALDDKGYCWGTEHGEAGVALSRPVAGGLIFRTQ